MYRNNPDLCGTPEELEMTRVEMMEHYWEKIKTATEMNNDWLHGDQIGM